MSFIILKEARNILYRKNINIINDQGLGLGQKVLTQYKILKILT